jgi:2-haloacid dehalogenase
VVTFDCYGTLIDWESGIGAAFKKSIEGAGLSGLQEYRVFELYEVEEKRVEAGATLQLYRDVLSLAGAQSSCITFALTDRFL